MKHSHVLIILTSIVSTIVALAVSPVSARPITQPVGYQLTPAGNTIRMSITNGTFVDDGKTLAVKNKAGATVFRLPLRYNVEYLTYPLRAKVAGKTATITPVTDRNQARPVANRARVDSVRQQAADKWAPPRSKRERDDQALSRFNERATAAMTISAWVGLAVGAVAGCVLGLAFLVVGCLPMASLGAMAGTLLGGGAGLIDAGIQYFTTITSPWPPKRAKPRR